MRSMFEETGKNCGEWGKEVKESVEDQQLTGRSSNAAATEYAFGNAMISTAKGLSKRNRKECHLSEEEKKAISAFDKLLESFDAGVKKTLDEINPVKAHGELFEIMIRKLEEAYINSSAEVFSFLWDVEMVKTQRFGTEAESGESFDEMVKAHTEKECPW